MAFIDDAEFIISHIRNSCVTSDDTGICEMVVVNEEVENEKIKQRRKVLGGRFLPDKDVMDLSSYSQSFDIAVSPELSLRDTKSGGKMETRKKERNHEIKFKTVGWKERQESLSDNELGTVFPKRSIKIKHKASTSSQLSKQLEESKGIPNNPFLRYSKFDGEAYQGTCPTKKLRIYLTMVHEDERIIPMFITVLGTASVQDLIGLIMYKYSYDNLEPPLEDDVGHYCLMIAEDDGEVDTDFPALDRKELITKFGFTCLALVELEKEAATKQAAAPMRKDSGVIVTVNEPQHGFSRVKVDSYHAKMKVVYDKMVKRRGLRRTGHEYVLEKKSEPGVAVNLEASLETIGTLDFVLTRGNRKRDTTEKDGEVKFDFTSYQYESFRGVYMVNKLRTVTEIQLGISHERVEIDPLSTPRTMTTKFWLVKQKPVSLDMENVTDCMLVDSKSTGRAGFRIWYFSNNSHEFKHYDFETEFEIADVIIKKLRNILKSSISQKRREFLAARERKTERRKTTR